MGRLEPNASKAERITASAILFTEQGNAFPCIVTAKRHSDCFAVMRDAGIEYDRTSCRQGFFTSRSRFVGREEAVPIARQAGQLKPGFSGKILFSEDLW